jgi:hypothetical protein
MLKLHPRSIQWRHLVPPIFVLSLLELAAFGFQWPKAWWLLGVETGTYLGLALAFTARVAGGDLRLIGLVSLVFLTVHFSWGSSFRIGLARAPRGIAA